MVLNAIAEEAQRSSIYGLSFAEKQNKLPKTMI